MKRIFFSIFLLTAFSAVAQTNAPLKTTWGLYEASGQTFDTLKTTTPVYLYTGPIVGFKDVVTITAVSTEIGDSTTAGTVSLEVSSDGVNWGSYYNSLAASYSQTLTNVSTAQVFRWKLENFTDKFARVKWVSTGGTISVGISGGYSVFTKPK